MAKQPETGAAKPAGTLRKVKPAGTVDIQAMPPFAAGQLITAADLNRLVEALKALDRRLARLEGR